MARTDRMENNVLAYLAGRKFVTTQEIGRASLCGDVGRRKASEIRKAGRSIARALCRKRLIRPCRSDVFETCLTIQAQPRRDFLPPAGGPTPAMVAAQRRNAVARARLRETEGHM